MVIYKWNYQNVLAEKHAGVSLYRHLYLLTPIAALTIVELDTVIGKFYYKALDNLVECKSRHTLIARVTLKTAYNVAYAISTY